MSKEYKEAYYKVLNILYPGYSEMSLRRQDDIEFRSMGITAYASEIDMLFDKMKDPNDPLYQEGASDKDIVNIAAIYARIHKESNKQIGMPTGKMLRGGRYGDVPVPEYKYQDRTEQEVEYAIERAVKEYMSKPRISIKNIISGVKKYDIDYTTALDVSKILKEMNANDRDLTQDENNKETER